MKKFIVAVLFVISLASQLVAEPTKFVDNNAALRYLMAIGFMPELQTVKSYELSNLNSLATFKALDPKIRQELESSSSDFSVVFSLLDQAARCTESTFIVDQNYNDDSLVPPYRSLRQFARIINALGWLDAEKGNFAGAARKFVHVFRLGLNLGGEGIAISGMFGIALQRIAVESINGLLESSKDAEARKILHDYFSSLPKPLIDGRLHIKNEKLYSSNTLKNAKDRPELFIGFGDFKDTESAFAKKAAADSACCANQRVLTGALEMYMMDYVKAPSDLDADAIIKKLVDEEYLKVAPVCERAGKYSIKFEGADDFSVSCSCGASLDAPVVGVSKKDVSPATLAKINAYVESGKFVSDKKELAEMFDAIAAVDAYAADCDEKAGKLAEQIENSKNTLINIFVLNPQSFYKSLRENQESVDELLKKLGK